MIYGCKTGNDGTHVQGELAKRLKKSFDFKLICKVFKDINMKLKVGELSNKKNLISVVHVAHGKICDKKKIGRKS